MVSRILQDEAYAGTLICHKSERNKIRKSAEGKYIWDYASVKNILTDESYTGVPTNHKREIHSGKSKTVDFENQFRHEDFLPAVISRKDWLAVQMLLKANARSAAATTGAGKQFAAPTGCMRK